MSRRPRTSPQALHNYTPDIDGLQLRLTAFMLRWQGVAPMPQALVEAVEELTTTVEELQAMNEDLTQSQEASIASQRRYQELFEGVPEAYLVTDLQGLIQEANRPTAHLFNIDRAHLTGLPLAVFIDQDMRSSFWDQLAWLQNGAEVREWVIRVQPRHLPAVPVVCHVAPSRNAEGALTGLRWLLRNLKAQQRAQEALEQQVRNLAMELVHTNSALQALQDRTELYMRELHHRMKNNLQVISSLLNWRLEDVQDPRVSAVVQECQGRIRVMAQLHEHLYHAADVERLELGVYLHRLALQVFEAYGIDRDRMALTLEADEVKVGISTAIPCGLLMHEVLANCRRHAFPGGQTGAVTITLRAEPAGQVTLTIQDTGIGVPADLDGDQGESLRFHLVRALTEQLQGTLVVTRNQGTGVTLRFPV
jgi:two-component sensor histidine kinase/PAS domain-containing protein